MVKPSQKLLKVFRLSWSTISAFTLIIQLNTVKRKSLCVLPINMPFLYSLTVTPTTNLPIRSGAAFNCPVVGSIDIGPEGLKGSFALKPFSQLTVLNGGLFGGLGRGSAIEPP